MEQIEYKGYTIKIVPDTDPTSPDEWGDEAVFLTAKHRQFYVCRQRFYPNDDLDLDTIRQNFFVFNLYAYIHSGVALALDMSRYPFNCPWDSGQVGYVYVSRGECKDEDGAKTIALGLIETWNRYLKGDIWGYEIRDANGDLVDSLWGIDDYDYAIEEAKRIVNATEKTRLRDLQQEMADDTLWYRAD